METIVLNIAISHLESSFSLEQSIGFQTWLKTQPPPQEQHAPAPAPVRVKKTIRVKKVQ
jgi:hypothetical protein